jgi:hypothetical protein
MSKNKLDWYVPSDWAFHFGFLIFTVTMAIMAGALLPLFDKLKTANDVDLYLSGLSAGCLGITLLFFARLPLYRQHRFFTFGPKALPGFHRKLYWLAYAMVGLTVLLFGMVWLGNQ